MIYLTLIILLLTGCSVKAYRDGDTLIGKGFGFKKATWKDGASIEKSEPIKIPDVIVPR